MLNILAEALDPNRNADLGESALYAILGFLIVFLGIAFLIFIVWGVGQLMAKFNGEKASVKKQEEPAPVVAPTSSVEEDELSDELVAVITAAITAYYQKENKKCDFTVKRIKRI